MAASLRRVAVVVALYALLPVSVLAAVTVASEIYADDPPTTLPVSQSDSPSSARETEPEDDPSLSPSRVSKDAPSPASTTLQELPAQQPTTAPSGGSKTPGSETSGASRKPPRVQRSQPVRKAPAPTTRKAPAPKTSASTTRTTPQRKPVGASTVFIWIAKDGAEAYRFELFRQGERIYVAAVDSPRVEVPPRWRYRSIEQRLEPGTYRWIVRPLVRRGGQLVPGAAIVQSPWVLGAP